MEKRIERLGYLFAEDAPLPTVQELLTATKRGLVLISLSDKSTRSKLVPIGSSPFHQVLFARLFPASHFLCRSRFCEESQGQLVNMAA